LFPAGATIGAKGGAGNWGGAVKTLVGMPVEPGSDDLLVIEVDASEVSDDLVLAATPGQVVVRAAVSLEEALNKLKPSLQKVLHLIKDLAPDQTTVEFGLQLGGETGVILAKGTAEVNFKVTMSWGHE
jgi:Trypsin-co-occurring domain 1